MTGYAGACVKSRELRARSGLRERIDELGVTVHEQFSARFADPQTIEAKNGLRLNAGRCGVRPGYQTTRVVRLCIQDARHRKSGQKLISLHAFGVGPHLFQFFDNRTRE